MIPKALVYKHSIPFLISRDYPTKKETLKILKSCAQKRGVVKLNRPGAKSDKNGKDQSLSLNYRKTRLGRRQKSYR